MKGKMLVFQPDHDHGQLPAVTEYRQPIGAGDLQKALGGYIEIVPYWDTFEVDGERVPAVVWCNENGKALYLPRNRYMTTLWDHALYAKGMSRIESGQELDFLVGPIAVTIGDAAFMESL